MTDKFLWKIYDLIETTEDVVDFVGPRTMSEAVYPDTRRLRLEYQKEKARRSFAEFIRYLGEKGYINIKALEATRGFILTPKGITKAIRAKRKFQKRRRRKDGLWIMVVFDISEKNRLARDGFRVNLADLGYTQFQKSVWVCPYDTYKETEEAIRFYKITSCVKMFLIKEI